MATLAGAEDVARRAVPLIGSCLTAPHLRWRETVELNEHSICQLSPPVISSV